MASQVSPLRGSTPQPVTAGFTFDLAAGFLLVRDLFACELRGGHEFQSGERGFESSEAVAIVAADCGLRKIGEDVIEIVVAIAGEAAAIQEIVERGAFNEIGMFAELMQNFSLADRRG